MKKVNVELKTCLAVRNSILIKKHDFFVKKPFPQLNEQKCPPDQLVCNWSADMFSEHSLNYLNKKDTLKV